jgi:hypothetical protein
MRYSVRNFVYIIIFLLSFTIPACNGNGTDSGSISSIDSKITLTPAETLSPTQRTLKITAQTERIYGCSNYSIVNDLSIQGNTISLNFTGIHEPSICLTALGPATASIDLGILSTAIYSLRLKVNGVTANVTLSATDTSCEISNGSGQWTDFSKTFFLKVPAGAIWGNVQYGDPNLTSTVYSRFVDSLKALGAQTHIYPEGDYNYFEIDATGQVVPPAYPHPNFVPTFIFAYNLDMLKVRALVKSFAVAYKSSMVFNLYGSNGEAYLSSVLINE